MKHKNKIKQTITASALIGACLIAGGCASIVHSGPRTVSINSQPSGAAVTITTADTRTPVHSGKTPMTVSLEPKRGFFKGQSYTVRLELEGYRSDEIVLQSKLSGWYFGNIIFGGLIGMLIVDPATGAMWNIAPEKIDRPLTTQQAQLLKEGNGFIVALLAETSESERAKMQKIN